MVVRPVVGARDRRWEGAMMMTVTVALLQRLYQHDERQIQFDRWEIRIVVVVVAAAAAAYDCCVHQMAGDDDGIARAW